MALIILDGFGINDTGYGDATAIAKTPNLDSIYKYFPHTQIGASGMDVGLPDGQMGNSEVGHTNIGAGRIVYQELTRISKSISDGDFFDNAAILGAIENAKKNSTSLHVMGLMSNGGVHSHLEHMYGILEMAKRNNLEKVYIHCFMDGRDVPPMSGADFLAAVEKKAAEIGVGKIATISGRYYAMDRDNRWERVEKAYGAMVNGVGVDAEGLSAETVMRNSYNDNVTDEFVIPAVLDKSGQLGEGDSVVFFNFRPDRAREITRTLVDPNFDGFVREKGLMPLKFVCMTQYDQTMPNVDVAFTPTSLDNTFGEYLSKHGLTQLRIAETEKYAHVTFFFNGGVETVYDGEDRVLIPSPKVPTYDLQPEMSAYEVTDALLQRIEEDKYDVIILNYANCDMVGHTGVFDAAVTACEAVDTCLGKIVDAIVGKQGTVLITADHGNADKMYEPDGSPFTAHSTNPVPFIVVGQGKCNLRSGACLADIAPTMLNILGLPKPEDMTGESIIVD